MEGAGSRKINVLAKRGVSWCSSNNMRLVGSGTAGFDATVAARTDAGC